MARRTAFAKGVAEQPENAEARFNLANVFFNKGQYKSAADSYREAIRLNPALPTRTIISACLYCGWVIAAVHSRNLKKPTAWIQNLCHRNNKVPFTMPRL
jgi:tetratricopeptide (TPR) repeat protein